VVNSAGKIAAEGVREIVLTGVNIGDFGRQNGESLFELLTHMEEHVDIPRMRISSIEPDLLSDDIIRLVAASKKFLPHFHIPMQSGSDKTLKAMHRKYSTGLYSGRIALIRSLIPHACIAADVIVGFPGETDEDFRETCDFIRELPLSYAHVFTYSKRENTLAAKSTLQVPDGIRKERSRLLHQVSADKKELFYSANIGSVREVLWESDHEDGMMHGFTDNYVRVRTKYDPALINQITPVLLQKRDASGIFIND
jgi:threonylcarbamoyladenosine tRNA methylthiotransferase MtaB